MQQIDSRRLPLRAGTQEIKFRNEVGGEVFVYQMKLWDKKSSPVRLFAIGVGVVALVVFLALNRPRYDNTRQYSPKIFCINNLRMIDTISIL